MYIICKFVSLSCDPCTFCTINLYIVAKSHLHSKAWFKQFRNFSSFIKESVLRISHLYLISNDLKIRESWQVKQAKWKKHRIGPEETDTSRRSARQWHKSWISRSLVLRIIQRNRRNFATPHVWFAFATTHWLTRLKRKFPSGNSLAVSNPLKIRKIFRRSRNVINTDCRPCSPPLCLTALQVSVLAPKSEERVHKENDALDNTERALGQAGIAKRRLVYQLVEVVDVQRARGDEQGASDEREEEILKDKRSHFMKWISIC